MSIVSDERRKRSSSLSEMIGVLAGLIFAVALLWGWGNDPRLFPASSGIVNLSSPPAQAE